MSLDVRKSRLEGEEDEGDGQERVTKVEEDLDGSLGKVVCREGLFESVQGVLVERLFPCREEKLKDV